MSTTIAKQRIELLRDFYTTVKQIEASEANGDEFRSKINRKLAAVRQAVADAGLPINVGIKQFGQVINYDLFLSFFESTQGAYIHGYRMDTVERAIGYYEGIENGLINPRPKGIIDIEEAILRALRPSFSGNIPGAEKQVQDMVSIILSSVGIAFTREAETAPVGARAFKPDFVVDEMSLALEVKLATSKHSPSAVQEEIMADISAYKTKWNHILFVIYDLGVINDPYKMKEDTMKQIGVTVSIIKH